MGYDVLRTKAGASLLGVNTGVVQGTAGSGVGGFGGGRRPRRVRARRTTGRWWSRWRYAGYCQLDVGYWLAITSFDPIVTGDPPARPGETPWFNLLSTRLRPKTPARGLRLPTGLPDWHQLERWFQHSRTTTTSNFATFSPQLQWLSSALTQHLLQGSASCPTRFHHHREEINRDSPTCGVRLQSHHRRQSRTCTGSGQCV